MSGETNQSFFDWLRRQTQKRVGRDYIFQELDPVKTAVVNVDMQHYFMSPGYQAACPMSLTIIPQLNLLCEKVRESGGVIIWVQTTADTYATDNWKTYEELHSPERWARRSIELAESHKGFKLHPDLDVRDEDIFTIKKRFSAFISGSSDLQTKLEGRGISTVLITGVATGVCCESTARDAMMLNYRVVMVSDALAAMTLDAHENSLKALHGFFADVQTVDEIFKHMGL